MPTAALQNQFCWLVRKKSAWSYYVTRSLEAFVYRLLSAGVVSLFTSSMERNTFQETMEEDDILAELALDTDSDIVDDSDEDPDFTIDDIGK